jgi:hypothetical protein
MRTRRHPLSGAIYDVRDDGLVDVDKHGVRGVFRPDGTWVSGDLREADPHLCGWLAGRQLPTGLTALTKDLPLVPTAKEGAR